MRATVKLPFSTPDTVRLTPSTATEPFSTRYCASEDGASILAVPPSCISRTRATPSTWPCTRCPPSRVASVTGRSRLTGAPGSRRESAVRRSVSSERSNERDRPSLATTVRQTPFTATEAPT